MNIQPQDYEKYRSNKQGDISFFKLEKDKDLAVIRFLFGTSDQIQATAVHTVQLGPRLFRSVQCLRQPEDPVEICPLCASQHSRPKLEFYLHMLVYPKDNFGNFTGEVTHKVWARPLSFYDEIAGWGQRYRNLSSMVFEVQRFGTGLQTDYKLFSTDYTVEECPITEEHFNLIADMNGRMNMIKTAEEMIEFLNTGAFAAKQDQSQVQPRETVQPRASVAPAPAPTARPQQYAPAATSQYQPQVVQNPQPQAQPQSQAQAQVQPQQDAAQPAYQPASQGYFYQGPITGAPAQRAVAPSPEQKKSVPAGRRQF